MMRYIDEYRDRKLINRLSELIVRSAQGSYTFMEVCGGHTASIYRFGIPSLLPDCIRLLSGPGCPVCVTATGYIDSAIMLSQSENVIIATFGDLMHVPGSLTTLEKMKAAGADIRVVLSALDALETARRNPSAKIVFLAIGFETTAPGTAVTITQAEREGIKNFFVLNNHKVIPPAMDLILKEGTKLDGFICPGHVATITGSDVFRFIPEKYKTGCVITGFEPIDILSAVLMLVNQVNNGSPDVEIQYTRAVTREGNRHALRFMTEVYEHSDVWWRGFGVIPLSGLKLRKKYQRFDAEIVFNIRISEREENKLCKCGDILRGRMSPDECPLFAVKCRPANPVGACMVSSEGACNTFFKYCGNE